MNTQILPTEKLYAGQYTKSEWLQLTPAERREISYKRYLQNVASAPKVNYDSFILSALYEIIYYISNGLFEAFSVVKGDVTANVIVEDENDFVIKIQTPTQYFHISDDKDLFFTKKNIKVYEKLVGAKVFKKLKTQVTAEIQAKQVETIVETINEPIEMNTQPTTSIETPVILLTTPLKYGRQKAKEYGHKRVSDEMALRYAEPCYYWEVRDLLEKKSFDSMKDLFSSFYSLYLLANNKTAKSALCCGFVHSAEKREHCNSPYFFKSDTDFQNLYEMDAIDINKIEAIIEYFTSQPIEPTLDELKAQYLAMPLDDLRRIKKEKYSNIDITTAKSNDEKAITEAIAIKFSELNQKIKEKRQAEKAAANQTEIIEATKEEVTHYINNGMFENDAIEKVLASYNECLYSFGKDSFHGQQYQIGINYLKSLIKPQPTNQNETMQPAQPQTLTVGQSIQCDGYRLVVTAVKEAKQAETQEIQEPANEPIQEPKQLWKVDTEGAIHLGQLSNLAYRAHLGTSMSPEKRASDCIKSYDKDLIEFLAEIPVEHQTWVKEKYISLFTAWLSAKSRCISSFIAGPSNFPVSHAQKYNNWEHGAYEAFVEWKEKTVKRLNRKEKVSIDLELIETENTIEQLKANQQMMKDCNKVVQSKKMSNEEKIEELENLGLSKANASKLLTPDYCNRLGFRGFELTNNNARIKHYEEKLAKLQNRINARNEETKKTTINGVRIVENIEADRLQIFFDGIPAENIRKSLKSNGFRWSPSNGCWQSYLQSGKYKINRLVLS